MKFKKLKRKKASDLCEKMEFKKEEKNNVLFSKCLYFELSQTYLDKAKRGFERLKLPEWKMEKEILTISLLTALI